MKYGHKGNAKNTTLAGGINATDLTITGVDLTGWPDGTTGPFWAAVDRGLLTEEKILCSGRIGNVLQVWTDVGSDGRGKDDTVAQSHAVNATLEHIWTATEADQASAHLELTDGAHGYPNVADIVTTTGAQTLEDKTLESATLASPTVNDPEINNATINNATFTGTVTGIVADPMSPFLLMGA